MSKSVYSLVLTDQVVEAADRLAYAAGISRSAFIDRILAEYAGYITPEMKINRIFDSLNKLFSESGSGFIVKAENQSMLIRSALKYKYKPTVRYGLQIFRSSDKTEGELKVSFRTQSEELKAKMEDFLRLWAALENRYIVKLFPDGVKYFIEDGRLTRAFTLPEEYNGKSTEEIGAAIAKYIQMFDDVLKSYFAFQREDEAAAAAAAAEKYRGYLEKGITII
ncbi:MAG: hypothetical protein NC394_01135 [Bacteroides sp.]|nr:hypothetical protein [Bacteroides sp.]